MLKYDSILKLLNIKQGEEKLVFLLIGYSFFMGGAMAVFYTLVASSFLLSFPSSVLPPVYIVGGVFVYGLGILITRLQKLISFDRLAEQMLAFLIVSIAGLLIAYHFTGNRWIFFVLFIWNRVFVLVNGVTFWAVVAKLFNLQQSKRLSSLISSGDVIASVLTYMTIPIIIKKINPDYALYSVIGFLIVCAVLINQIHRRYVRNHVNYTPMGSNRAEHADDKAFEKSKIKSSYYWKIFLLALIPVFALFYVEYIFFTESRVIFPNKTSLASFLGLFFGVSAMIEFFIKTVLYSKILSKYGLRAGIVILPLSLVFSCSLAVLYGLSYDTAGIFFACIVLARFFMSAVRKSISDPVYQVLYQPLPAAMRLEIQARIEGRAKSIGGLLAGVVLLLLIQVPNVNSLELTFIFLLITFYWITIAIRSQAAYTQIIRERVFPVTVRSIKALSRDMSYEFSDQPLDELLRLASSPKEQDRIEAAKGLGESRRYLSGKYLIPLIRDQECTVKEAAIVAAGRYERPELWPYLLEQLHEDRFAVAARDSLIRMGPPLLRQLDKYFLSSTENKIFQLKLIDIVEGIGGEEGIRFLRKKISHPERILRERVINSLRNLGYTATTTEQSVLLQELDDHFRIYAWLLAGEVDLEREFDSKSQLMIVIEREKKQTILKAFAVLALVYGEKFNVIHLYMDDQDEDIRGYLVEICDLMLPENVKNKVLPFLDSDSRDEILSSYQLIFPQEKLSVEERIKDIINKDYTRITRWAKSVAMKELQHYASESVTPILVSNAMSSAKVISETAFYVLRIVNPARFASLFATINLRKDTFHKSIMEPLEWLASEEDLMICKLRRLREMEELSKQPNEDLLRILLHSTYFQVEEDEVKDLRKFSDGKDVSIVLTYGSLAFSKGQMMQGGDIWNVAEKRAEGIVMIPHVIKDSEFYVVESYILKDLTVVSDNVKEEVE